MNMNDIRKTKSVLNLVKTCLLFVVCTSVFATPIYIKGDGLTDAQKQLQKEQMRINAYKSESKDDEVVITPMGGCTPTPGCVGNAIQ
ncbi:hypothetical protein Sps_04937 [Shewanella psychrophila]|uniref:Uncharacterized protein n=1 Tax=Shewanella psychrophila TaxID=225848 RepID=A0A1S6HWR4_9GAMM|nr:hypothetical protein [Shewanella psychrophila]AQS40017.1 hypothetical protein Sps_04937 [Shewanella psychrophila]